MDNMNIVEKLEERGYNGDDIHLFFVKWGLDMLSLFVYSKEEILKRTKQAEIECDFMRYKK